MAVLTQSMVKAVYKAPQASYRCRGKQREAREEEGTEGVSKATQRIFLEPRESCSSR